MRQEFLCRHCGRYKLEPMSEHGSVVPVCHNEQMVAGAVRSDAGRDTERLSVDIIQLRGGPITEQLFGEKAPLAGWQLQGTYEVWFLAPGRERGERVGWLRQGMLGWEYRMGPGVPEADGSGVAVSRKDAVTKMLLVLAS